MTFAIRVLQAVLLVAIAGAPLVGLHYRATPRPAVLAAPGPEGRPSAFPALAVATPTAPTAPKPAAPPQAEDAPAPKLRTMSCNGKKKLKTPTTRPCLRVYRNGGKGKGVK